MDRTKYLQLCQLNAVYPKSKKVKHKGVFYYPKKRVIGFDNSGKEVIVAWMQSVTAGQCDVFVKLSEVEYEETV
jgi:hypothetical protein